MWEIVGFESRKNDSDQIVSYTVHAIQAFKQNVGVGTRTYCKYYRVSDVDYVPRVGDKVIFVVEEVGKFTKLVDVVLCNE